MQSLVLVIVPCGVSKIWDKDPNAGPTLAQDAYCGAPFRINRQYAEFFGHKWIILSAKYGFIPPDFELPGPYEVTFGRKSPKPVSTDYLRQQVKELSMDQFATVIGLGGKEYRHAITEAFEGQPIELKFPFSGLTIGRAISATKNAIMIANRVEPSTRQSSWRQHLN